VSAAADHESRAVRFAAVHAGEQLPECNWFMVFGVAEPWTDSAGRTWPWLYHVAYTVDREAES
jgi:hypothetical protein